MRPPACGRAMGCDGLAANAHRAPVRWRNAWPHRRRRSATERNRLEPDDAADAQWKPLHGEGGRIVAAGASMRNRRHRDPTRSPWAQLHGPAADPVHRHRERWQCPMERLAGAARGTAAHNVREPGWLCLP